MGIQNEVLGNAGDPYPADGDPHKRFVALPIALDKKVVNSDQGLPINVANTYVANGLAPPKAGVVHLADLRTAEDIASYDFLALRQEGRNDYWVLPLPKDAVDDETRKFRSPGVEFFVYGDLFRPVSRVLTAREWAVAHDMQLPVIYQSGGLAVARISHLDIGDFEATDRDVAYEDQELGIVTGAIRLRPRIRRKYF
jgi:hypothetical protein